MAFMMGNLSGSSAQVTESIRVIEGTAFQPLILALNAPRGAARAAVAGELHNPAQRSSVDAGAIKELSMRGPALLAREPLQLLLPLT